MPFETKHLPATPDVTAPDGSGMRVLLTLAGGSMVNDAARARQTPRPAVHGGGLTCPLPPARPAAAPSEATCGPTKTLRALPGA